MRERNMIPVAYVWLAHIWEGGGGGGGRTKNKKTLLKRASSYSSIPTDLGAHSDDIGKCVSVSPSCRTLQSSSIPRELGTF